MHVRVRPPTRDEQGKTTVPVRDRQARVFDCECSRHLVHTLYIVDRVLLTERSCTYTPQGRLQLWGTTTALLRRFRVRIVSLGTMHLIVSLSPSTHYVPGISQQCTYAPITTLRCLIPAPRSADGTATTYSTAVQALPTLPAM